MSAFVVFDCLAILPTESIKKFKDLFHQVGDDPEKENFGVTANWNETEIGNGKTQIVFDCQNGQGIYWGWYKKKIGNKNMEEYCTELQIEKLTAFNDWHEDMDNEYWMYLKGDGLTLLSQENKQSPMKVDVDQRIDYIEQKIFKTYHTIDPYSEMG